MQIVMVAILSVLLVLAGCGCSPKRMMVRTARTMLPDALAAFNDEPDWELARTSGFSNLKLLETLHRGTPEDEEILVTLAQAFGGVALVFLEDDMEALRGAGGVPYEEARQRAADFYIRGRDFAGQALELMHPGFLGQVNSGGDTADQALGRLSQKDVPALFWYAFNQAGGLWLDRSNPAALRAVPVNRRLALRLGELDEAYFFGGPLLLLGIADAWLPPMLGGSLEQSDRRFRRAAELSEGTFLLARVLHAQHYAVAAGNRGLFETELQTVLDAPADILPGYRLFTVLAQRRARMLIPRADDLF
jgi:hypothetical protein